MCHVSGTVQARNHVEIMEALDLIDFDTAGDVSGSKFYYLRNAAALLEIALVNFAVQVLLSLCLHALCFC
jgi:seryl-tRNA synthetase